VYAPWLQPEPIEHESQLEKAFVEVAVLCPAVRRIEHQPFWIDYELPGEARPRRHVPDYLVQLDNARLLVEVKPRRFLPKHCAKFDAVAPLVAKKGLPYYVITDDELPRATVEQAGLWRRYARSNVDRGAHQRLAARVDEGRPATLSALAEEGVALDVIYHMLGRRELRCVDGLGITPDSRLLSASTEELLDERLFFDHWFNCSQWTENLATRTPD
jgi:hypothetical protein